METESKYAIILAVFFALSLVASVVLFSYLESYAEVVNPTYRLGGAIAGFFVIFVTLCTTYSRMIKKPASKIFKDIKRGTGKPREFSEYKSEERGFSIYYPREWEVIEPDRLPPISFQRGDGPNVQIISEKQKKKVLLAVETDPSEFSVAVRRFLETMFKDYTVLEESAIALHGIRCPVYIGEKTTGSETVRQVYTVYPDVEAEKIHMMVLTVGAGTEFEDVKPVFDKMLSTFQAF